MLSDGREKQDITSISNALDVIRALNPVRYHWKYDPSGAYEYGLIAQEYVTVFPDFTMNTDNGTGEIGPGGPWEINDSPLMPYVIAAIKQLDAQVQALASQIP